MIRKTFFTPRKTCAIISDAMLKRFSLVLLLILVVSMNVSGSVSSYILPLSSSIYDDMDALYRLTGQVPPSTSRPWSAAEARLILSRLDEESMTVEPTDTPEETLNDSLSSFKGPFFPITMYISVLKGKKNETEIRMLTEMGVGKIVLINTEFTEGIWNSHMSERINSIAREAVQQSGSRAPEIYGPIPFEKAIEEAEGTVLILHQSSRTKTQSLTDIDFGSRVSCMIGPEGGFSDKECSLAEEHGAIPVLLKTNILRAETAAIYTASSLQTILHKYI